MKTIKYQIEIDKEQKTIQAIFDDSDNTFKMSKEIFELLLSAWNGKEIENVAN